jgi:tail protein X
MATIPSTILTRQDEMWDALSFRIWGSEFYMDQLMDANPQYSDVIDFDANTLITVPTVTAPVDTSQPPFVSNTKSS